MNRLMAPGEKCGRLTVLELVRTDARHRKYWLCQCDCGNTTVTHTNSLRQGNTRSCGCLAKDVAAARRISNSHGEVTAVILGYKRHAKRRGFSWSLTREEVVGIIGRPCFYCGAPPSNAKTTKNTIEPLLYSGIDRIDNKRGYEIGNVTPCCRVCNIAKSTLSIGEFAAWAKRLAAMAEQWSPLVTEAAA